MSIRRVALIFDDELRPETTGVYCRRALEGLVEVKHVRPSDLSGLQRLNTSTPQHLNAFDLYLRIDDGLDYRMPEGLHPSAFWAIDTHLDFEKCLAQAREFDLVFAAQRDGAERLRVAGITSAEWLPLACDPETHRKHEVAKELDVCFVGNIVSDERAELVSLIKRRFPNTFVGQRYFDEMAKTYSASRIVFNRSVRNDINMRVFEALACGSLLLTNDLSENGQEELFQDGVHLATYREPEELLDKLAYYLNHDDVRERIAAAGREAVLAQHAYRHRMEWLLKRAECGGRRAMGQVSGVRDQESGVGVQGSRVALEQGSGRAGMSMSPDASTHQRLNASAPARDRSYFEFSRPELLALVPETARRVLDIGCGAGRLGESIKARQGAEVIGIELDETAADEAKGRLDQVMLGNVEALEPDFAPGSFDCIVCGDILEHLDDPVRLLRRARSWLSPGGRLVSSIPNVRHHSVIRSLLDGNWTYESAGLLDRDHVQFFTRRAIEELFREAGFAIEQIQAVPGPGYEEWVRSGRPASVRIGGLFIGNIPVEEAEEFYVYQFLVTARPFGQTRVTPAAVPQRAMGSSFPGSAWERIGDEALPLLRRCDAATQPARAQAEPGHENIERPARHSRMRFQQNFITDFDQFDFWAEPFAFARFGDGERAICSGRRIEAQDGWKYDGNGSPFAADLNAALRYHDPGYYIGISDGCCDRPARDWFLDQIALPLEQVTFANIFVNWNYRRFRQLNLSGAVIVSNGGGDFWVPSDLVNGGFDIDGLVEQLLGVDRPILLAAGPASCVIAHKYWMRADPARRQTIVDVGSAIDERTKGHKTRQYQHPGTRTAELICTW